MHIKTINKSEISVKYIYIYYLLNAIEFDSAIPFPPNNFHFDVKIGKYGDMK